MDLYPFWNSLRIAAISCGIVFFLGILCAHYVAKLPRVLKGILDVILTLPLVLPPTVVGYLLLVLLGPNRIFGSWMMSTFHTRMTMVWYSAVFASAIVAFPLMYRTARGAFESFDPNLRDSARTLGLSNTYIFWRIQMPCCRQGILAGTVLAFARSTTVYQLWRTNNEALAFRWVMINIAISFVVLMAVNLLERRERREVRK